MVRVKNSLERVKLGWRLRHQRWQWLSAPLPKSVAGIPVLDRIFQLLDLLMAFDAYEAVGLLLFPRLRPLTSREYQLLYDVFGGSLPYAHLRIDEHAHLGPRTAHFYYVSFLTINSWGRMPDDILIHEAVHVWQYVHRGAVYIPRALAAQATEAGYNYGGVAGLQTAGDLDDFNYEQMADVVADAYRISHYRAPRWMVTDGLIHLALFEKFLLTIKFSPVPLAYNRK